MDILNVNHLSVTFSAFSGAVRAVRDVSFAVRESEVLAMVGESGCGKSVTAKAVMRLLDRTSAAIAPESEVLYDGKNLLALSKRELNRIRGNDISMVFQDAMASLNPTMTVGKQLVEVLRRHKNIGKAEAIKQAGELLRMVELPEPADQLTRYPHQLSGGQRQRVMIAMALACEPKLLIADEPTTALDVTIQAQILGLIQRLQRRLNMAVLLITHDLGIVAGIADRVQVMYGGRIVERGTTSEIFHDPRHPYTAALLSAIPRRDMERLQALTALPGSPPDLRLELPGCPFAPRCRYCMPVCEKAMPEETVGEHAARCWLHHPMAPHVELKEALKFG